MTCRKRKLKPFLKPIEAVVADQQKAALLLGQERLWMSHQWRLAHAAYGLELLNIPRQLGGGRTEGQPVVDAD